MQSTNTTPKLMYDVQLVDCRVNVSIDYQVTASSPTQAMTRAIKRAKKDSNLPPWDHSFAVLSCKQRSI